MNPRPLIRGMMQQKKEALIKKMHSQIPGYFLERAVCDINDNLTSILAVADTEAPSIVPKVKKYIQKINQHLQKLKTYQTSVSHQETFNVNMVVANVLNVIEENMKEVVEFSRIITEIKAFTLGNQSDFENFMLGLLLEMTDLDDPGKNKILIELRQRDNDAVITILKDQFIFEEKALKQLEDDAKKMQGKVSITPQGKGVEIIIQLPMVFQAEAMPVTVLAGAPKVSVRLESWSAGPKKAAFSPHAYRP